jgi:hypothetical protein
MQYRDSTTMAEVETRYLAIHAWWLSSGTASEKSLRSLDLWLVFWYFRYQQWGGFMQLVSIPHLLIIWIFKYKILASDTSQTCFPQDLDEDELAEMPSCNLTETVHNKWLQASGNRGNDLYTATVDNYIRAFTQVVAYYQFLKGDVGGTGPSKEELKLRNAHRRARVTGDPRVLRDAMLEMPSADEFCTRDPHLEGEEVFGSLKRKPNVPLGADGESHRPDTVNYSRPRASKRAALAPLAPLPVIAEESDADVEEVVATPGVEAASPALEGGIRRVTSVHETKVNERTWHIARLPKESSKACWAQRAVTKKKCSAKIVRNAKSTPAPTYTGEWLNLRVGKQVTIQFYFCSDDIERCVKGTRRKWVTHYSKIEPRPPIPDV